MNMLHYETFRQTLVHVKAWAKRRGIYGSIMGYPGGVAWTILTAYYCRQRWQNGDGDGLRSPPTVGSVLMQAIGFESLTTGLAFVFAFCFGMLFSVLVRYLSTAE